MPFVILGWLWAWWCSPEEMMRQRRERLAKHVTRMYEMGESDRVRGFQLRCSCGWSRITYKTSDVSYVRQILDNHEKENTDA